jgi:predicted PurR-regulated permease PerM
MTAQPTHVGRPADSGREETGAARRKEATAMANIESTPRAVLRTVLIVVSVVLTIYIIYLLRRPLSWIVIAGFLAIAVSGPVAVLQKRMPRGAAIALVYVTLVAVPLTIAALLIPEVVGQGEDLVNKAPEYAQDVTDSSTTTTPSGT